MFGRKNTKKSKSAAKCSRLKKEAKKTPSATQVQEDAEALD